MNIKSLPVPNRKFLLRLRWGLWPTALVLAIVTAMLASNVNDVEANNAQHFRCHGDWVEEGDEKKIEIERHATGYEGTIFFTGGTATKGVDFKGESRSFPRSDDDFTIYDQTYEDTERESDETYEVSWTRTIVIDCHFRDSGRR